MIHNKKVIVVMPAYNAEYTVEKTYNDIPHDIVDDIILVDDASMDKTVQISNKLGIQTIIHEKNIGYGGNQKTCYRKALELNADIIIMLHPDYQYDPKLISALASMIASGCFDAVIGSRILGKGALKGGMPLYKFVSNRLLTFIQNIMLNYKLSEYHTGYRAFSRHTLENLPFENNSNDFLFDNEILVQMIYYGYRIGEISCPTRYLPDSSSINVSSSIKYGIGILLTCAKFMLQRLGLIRFPIFDFNKPQMRA